MCTASRLLLPVVILCFASACGGPSTTPPVDTELPGIDGNGTFLDEAVRIDTIREAKLAQSTGGATRAEQDAAMVAFFLAHKNIEAAGIGDQVGNVWARFIDGTLYMDFSARDQDIPVVRPPITPRIFELPGKVIAITGNSLESWWPDTSVSVANMLKKGSTYNVTAQKAPLKFADFEAMRDVGVLYWQTHSGQASLRTKVRDAAGNVLKDPVTGKELRVQAFSYQTNDIAMVVPTAEIKALRDQNMLTLGNSMRVRGSVNPADADEVYGITASFIEAKMMSAFASDALVAIDSCTGATPEMLAAWRKVGVGGFVSWDGLSGDKSGVQFERLFDRLLGANTIAPISRPNERPFAFEPVRDWMKAKGYDLDPSQKTNPTDRTVQLVFWNKPSFGILRPSITNILWEASNATEPYAKLLIQGTFGTNPGDPRRAVTWGGMPMTIVRWEDYGVVVRVPPGPTYPTGPIVVSVDGRKSQEAHFTEWNLPLTFTKTDRGTLKVVMTANCYLRADVRGFRFTPEETPRFTLMTTNSLKDSSGSITGSGQYVSPTTGMVQTTWTGTNMLTPAVTLDRSPLPTANYVACSGYFDQAGGHPLKLLLPFSGSYTIINSSGGMSQGVFSPQLHYQLGLTIPVDWSTRTILGGSLPGMQFNPTETVTVSWPTVTPTITTGVVDDDAR